MTDNRAIGKIRMLLHRLSSRFNLPFPQFPRLKPRTSMEMSRLAFENPHSFAYQLIGDKTEHILPLFEDLDVHLKRAGVKINFRAYVSLTVFFTILVSFGTLAVMPTLLFLSSNYHSCQQFFLVSVETYSQLRFQLSDFTFTRSIAQTNSKEI